MKTRFLYYCFTIVLSLSGFLQAYGQEISAEASAKMKDYLVGDRINVTIVVKRPQNFSVEWRKQDPVPIYLELVDSVVKDSMKENGLEKINILLPLAGFDSGVAVYPAQLFVFRKKGDTTSFTLKTRPLSFHISSITVDLKKDIKPIAGPMEPGWDLKTIILYIMAGFVIVALLLAAWLYWKKQSKRHKETLPVYIEPQRPPWELAIEQLAQLQKDDLPAQGRVKDYYISLSLIIRQFISERLEIDALELSTEELEGPIKRKNLPPETCNKLNYLLELADSVKFARYIPDVADHEKAIDAAYFFVESMREKAA